MARQFKSLFVYADKRVQRFTRGLTELALSLPRMAVNFVNLRVRIKLSIEIKLLQPAFRNLASVAGFPRFEDVEWVAHKIIGPTNYRVIFSSDHWAIEPLSFVPRHLSFAGC